MVDLPDFDFEVLHREEVVKLFPEARIASQKSSDGNKLTRHNTGLYFQNIPIFPDGLSALPYDQAEKKGFAKVDIMSAPADPYAGITSMTELKWWMTQPIDWSWFTNESFVSRLFHFSGTTHIGHDPVPMARVVAYYTPQSIDDVAVLAALKLPPKYQMIGDPLDKIRETIWIKERKINFKKAHAIAYALAIAVQARRMAADG